MSPTHTSTAAKADLSQTVSNKRKPQLQRFESESEDDDMEDSDDDEGDSFKKGSALSKTSASQQLVPVPGNPDAPLVTKRTLQNRKAQREFRKRREARVRELEERCRRFDQMGLESNADLQRIAQRLKDENEALKSHVAGLGFAHTIPALLDSLTSGKPSMPAQSYPPLDLSMDAWARGPEVPTTGAQHAKSTAHASSHNGAPSSAKNSKKVDGTPSSQSRSSLIHQPAFDDLLPTSRNNSSVNPSLLSDSKDVNRANTTSKPLDNSNATFDNDWFAQLAQSGHDKDEDESDSHAQQTSDANSYNPILSLNFANNNNKQDKNTNKHGLASNSLSGSAMLGSKQGDFGSAFGYPSTTYGNNMLMPMPTQQNGALLNPNPIPFAFNLSDPKNPGGDQSWWSQMANNQLAGDDDTLDEKAQAVAQATAAASNGGAPSPFDLSAFLNGGMTPGGGMFTFSGQQSGDGPSHDSGPNSGDGGDNASGSTARPLTQAEHAQMFLRLMEAKVAKGNASPYAQLGFQPPLHQQQQRTSSPRSGSDSSSDSSSKSRTDEDDITSLSPINVYSRLSQHPAFLSTNASELEELVDSISGPKTQAKKHGGSTPRSSSLYPTTPNVYNGASLSASPASSGKSLEVDETAVSKMLGLLDRKTPRESATTSLSL